MWTPKGVWACPLGSRAVGQGSPCSTSTSLAWAHDRLCWPQGSSVARTMRRWTGITARAEQAGPVAVDPSRAAEEAGGTRGGKICMLLTFSWHHCYGGSSPELG